MAVEEWKMVYLRGESNKVVFVFSEERKVISGEGMEIKMWYLGAVKGKKWYLGEEMSEKGWYMLVDAQRKAEIILSRISTQNSEAAFLSQKVLNS